MEGIISHHGSTDKTSASKSRYRGYNSHLRQDFFHMLVPPSACAVGAELSYLGFGWEGNSNTVQPYIYELAQLLNNLIIFTYMYFNYIFKNYWKLVA